MAAELPNGSVIRSTATGTLETPPIFTKVHIFPDDQLDRSLISPADYCNAGCTAIFTATSATIIHDETGEIVILSTKALTDRLWPFQSPEGKINTAVKHEINADFVTYTHACFGSPTDSCMLKALKKGNLSTLPRLTTKMFSSNLPNSPATAKGHLDQTRQGSQSTTKKGRRKRAMEKPVIADSDVHAIRETYDFFKSKGNRPEIQTLDNETSAALETFLTNKAHVKLNFVPPNTHRRNRAERAIRDWKSHFISTLATVDPNFPMSE